MGKRNTLVVLSSDDEGERSLSSNHRYSKSKSSSTVPRANPKRSKKARGPGSTSSLSKESCNWDEIRFFCEDLDEGLSGCKLATGSGRSNKKELWVDKYKPRFLDELAVNKKKVEEVKLWFEERLKSSKDKFSSHVLVVTGPAGVGKSATIHVIASRLGATLSEWNTPTPILWQEHLHNSTTGIHYRSKLDEFENFVERVSKYGMIPAFIDKDAKSSMILLIDDLPVTNGRVALGRLKNCLYILVRSTQIPTAILFTNYGEADSADHTNLYLEELQLSLESAGACKVAFNPITHNSIKKILSKICRQEQHNVPAEQIDLIAKSSGGDIRQAITSLQFFCLKPSLMRSLSLSSPFPTLFNGKPDEVNIVDSGISLHFGRDETLSLFHALGKFLHNKREIENTMELDGDEFFVRKELSRLPLKMEAPEKILCQAHGQARPIADFLHENVQDFLSDEAINDAWTVASYLGDADLLLATFRGMLARHNEVENVLQSAAASVAVRGVLFGNFHPLPPRWHAIRRPKLWQIEQSSLSNKKEMVKRRYDLSKGLSSSDATAIAIDYTPLIKWLGFGAAGGRETCEGNGKEEEIIDMMNLDEQESFSDDEIEDW
ncbi:cell cycle checkpoint protein RAD17 isoform X2 [Ziziphus jujuba]|uniref:Cell cycle checkpoint protein RAD17 isoform X2 n=1 Tax=Ziziphus jujuba TaxID=326968 RepID=A0A6P6FV36_ZIZJJ|nr:cell cycle checkpoint protein RAD17 isoform X2 [Ziziphus jujuba]